jgi:2-polyprenyl-3-methyl-5-hydroxy-6-metoxy-1,4-benzoquinol methylase
VTAADGSVGTPADDDDDDQTRLVRQGYDVLSYRYRGDDADEGEYAPWLAALKERVPAGGLVLDVGCGCGVPVARSLAEAGFAVRGIDISETQIERARRLVPAARFMRADATRIGFGNEVYDAVVCLYALIHMALDKQPKLLLHIARWLRPGGWLLATTGSEAWTGTEENWLGGPAPMWWSQGDAADYRTWLRAAGLEIIEEDFVPEGDGGHALFWARKPADAIESHPAAVLAWLEARRSGSR